MKRYNLRFTKWVWVAWVVLAILVGCVAPAAEETATVQPVTATATMAAVTPSPTVTLPPTLSPTMATETPASESSIPLCTFATDDAPEVVGPSLDDYVFSEPQVVLTHTSAIGIIEWLPNEQRILITRRIPDSLNEYVDTFNMQAKKIQHYGERHGFSAGFNPKPVWLVSKQAAAFGDIVNKQWVLRISQGTEMPVEEIVIGLTPLYLTASPNGRQLVFFPDMITGRPEIFDTVQAQRLTLPFVLPQIPASDLSIQSQPSRADPYQAVWHPDGSRIAFYNNIGFYLAGLDTGQMCEVDLGIRTEAGKLWAVDAKWSPNGRYLAALVTAGEPVVSFIGLALLDMDTGELSHINLGYQYLYTIAWAPNNRNLLIMAEAGQGDLTRANQYDLHLIDVVTGETRQMLAEHTFMFSGIYGAVWSSTGQEIALACPTVTPADGTIAEGRLCLVVVGVE